MTAYMGSTAVTVRFSHYMFRKFYFARGEEAGGCIPLPHTYTHTCLYVYFQPVQWTVYYTNASLSCGRRERIYSDMHTYFTHWYYTTLMALE